MMIGGYSVGSVTLRSGQTYGDDTRDHGETMLKAFMISFGKVTSRFILTTYDGQ